MKNEIEVILTYLLIIWNVVFVDAIKKNALLILADDAGFQMGAYGNKICQTPNLDKLAHRSLIFNNAYTSVSSCSPSRAALLTGTPSHQNGMYGLHQAENHFNSFEHIESLPNRLRKEGIHTGIIGKKHVGPSDVYKFDYEQTEENNKIIQVGRNITYIKLLVREFLNQTAEKPFFLYLAFHDPHRCGHTSPEYGEFCQDFGNGAEGMGHIPDWVPIYYNADDIQLPYYLPQTRLTQQDLSAQYTAMSRLDQGVGLILKELESAGKADETLIIYTSDNGIPFPNGRTNLYDSGINEPMLISSPINQNRRNQVTYSLTSLLDLKPTLLDWFDVDETNEIDQNVTGRSLLSLLNEEPKNTSGEVVFASHNLHEITMYYPMRMIRTHRYKLIHNLNYNSPFPIDQDLYVSYTFQQLLNLTITNQNTYWFKSLKNYYKRPEWEFYDIRHDPEELHNLYDKMQGDGIVKNLKKQLFDWLNSTNDPWLCAPHAVLENKGDYKLHPQCMGLYNEI